MTREERKADAKKAYAALMKFYPFTLEDIDGEQWADIPNYEGLYQVSTFGRVKSFKYNAPRIMKPAVNKGGYLVVQLMKSAKVKCIPIHRLVALTHISNPNNLPQVDHRYGMKFDNSVDNLRWVTNSTNMQSAYNLGLMRIPKGEQHYQAKLSNEQVLIIRENASRMTMAQLAKQFNVDEATIINIQLGNRYKDAGGTIRSKIDKHKLSFEVREQVRAEYQKGVRGHGLISLAKKYGVNGVTILNIIKGK